jgi:hypothetical protein
MTDGEFKFIILLQQAAMGHFILATPSAFIRNLHFQIFRNSLDIWCTQPMHSPNPWNGPTERFDARWSVVRGLLTCSGFMTIINYTI